MAEKTFDEIHAQLIAEKMAVGLTRDQAITVIKSQIEWDELQEREAKKAKVK